MSAQHPGFRAVQQKIARKEGFSEKVAGAILAASTRKASAKAKAANPRLKRVMGEAKPFPNANLGPKKLPKKMPRGDLY